MLEIFTLNNAYFPKNQFIVQNANVNEKPRCSKTKCKCLYPIGNICYKVSYIKIIKKVDFIQKYKLLELRCSAKFSLWTTTLLKIVSTNFRQIRSYGDEIDQKSSLIRNL